MEFVKPKHQARLEHWRLMLQANPPAYVLMGHVFEHPKCTDGEPIVTSPVLTIDFVNRIAETKNTFYKLSSDMCNH